jgi:opacity protein-like surface antigen
MSYRFSEERGTAVKAVPMMTFSKPNSICRLGYALAAAIAAAFCQTAAAQVAASGIGAGHTLWGGAEYVNYSASFPYKSGQRLTGYQFFGNYDFTAHLAAEADVRLLNQSNFYGESESDYLAGPQFRTRRYGRFQFYGQYLAGLGKIQFPFSIGNGNYFAFDVGGGMNYRIAHHWQMRAGYDYEIWFNSPNVANQPDDPITPNGFHAGLAFSASGGRK